MRKTLNDYREIWHYEFLKWRLKRREKIAQAWQNCADDDIYAGTRQIFIGHTLQIGEKPTVIDGGLLLVSKWTGKTVSVANWIDDGDTLILCEIAVSPDVFRRKIKGVGTQTMKSIGKIVIDDPEYKEGLTLSTFEDNVPFYQKLGLVSYHVENKIHYMSWERSVIQKMITC